MLKSKYNKHIWSNWGSFIGGLGIEVDDMKKIAENLGYNHMNELADAYTFNAYIGHNGFNKLVNVLTNIGIVSTGAFSAGKIHKRLAEIYIESL